MSFYFSVVRQSKSAADMSLYKYSEAAQIGITTAFAFPGRH